MTDPTMENPQTERSWLPRGDRPFPPRLQQAGVAGAGGAGFPADAKWECLDDVDALFINHQASESEFIKDRWIGREYTETLAAFFDASFEFVMERVVDGTKAHYRGVWLGALEEATDATVRKPDEQPIEDHEGPVVACTGDRYEFDMESVRLRERDEPVIGRYSPLDHGWIVQNTEAIHNTARAMNADEPVTHKLLHVDGDTPRHQFLMVPIGTPATDLLAAAGCPGPRDPR